MNKNNRIVWILVFSILAQVKPELEQYGDRVIYRVVNNAYKIDI
jgi:hypothetical protein